MASFCGYGCCITGLGRVADLILQMLVLEQRFLCSQQEGGKSKLPLVLLGLFDSSTEKVETTTEPS